MSLSRCMALKEDILHGRMLTIDPSSGSIDSSSGKASQLGWAIFDEGALEASGVVDIKSSRDKTVRFRSLLHTLQSEFDEDFDVLIVEDIPITPKKRGKNSFNTSQTLIQACGVIIACLSGEVVEMNSATWQAIARRIGGWKKSDESDAQFMGLAAIAFAAGYQQSMSEKIKIEFIGDLVNDYDGWGLHEIINHWRLQDA